MDHLRDGIGLRGYGQRDPKLEFKKEGFDMFQAMESSVNHSVLQKLFQTNFRQPEADVQLLEAAEMRRFQQRQRSMVTQHPDYDPGLSDEAIEPPVEAPPVDTTALSAVRAKGPSSRRRGAAPSSSASSEPASSEASEASPREDPPSEHLQPVRRSGPKIGRNDPCPCGSGKKYKVCHGQSGAESENA
jgi:preprotein translocase subunit SecA